MFRDREEAGRLLALKLKNSASKNLVIFGVTRGGIVVAYQVSHFLKLPLIPIIVKKIGAPNNSELALGAVTYNKIHFLDEVLCRRLQISSSYLKNELRLKSKQVRLLTKEFGINNTIDLKKKTAVVVDDGIATGATIRVVLKYLNDKQVQRTIIAVPVISNDVFDQLKKECDIIIALKKERFFKAVGQFYESFPQVSNEDVVKFLNRN